MTYINVPLFIFYGFATIYLAWVLLYKHRKSLGIVPSGFGFFMFTVFFGLWFSSMGPQDFFSTLLLISFLGYLYGMVNLTLNTERENQPPSGRDGWYTGNKKPKKIIPELKKFLLH